MVIKYDIKDIDRTLYEKFRLLLVGAGNLPDITQMSNQVEYERAKQSLFGSGNLIDLYGVGAPFSRDGIVPARVTIDMTKLAKDSVGAYGLNQYEKVDDKFIKSKIGDSSYTIGYEVRIITNDRNILREFLQLAETSIGSIDNLDVVDSNGNPTENTVLVMSGDWVDVSSIEFLEYVCQFEIPDIWLKSTSNDRIEVPMLVDVQQNIVAGIDKITKEVSDGGCEILIIHN